MSITDFDPPPVDIYIPTHSVQRLIEDLDSLAEAWNSLAVTYRLGPSGFWARVADHDQSDRADVLENAARQLLSAVSRFQEGIG